MSIMPKLFSISIIKPLLKDASKSSNDVNNQTINIWFIQKFIWKAYFKWDKKRSSWSWKTIWFQNQFFVFSRSICIVWIPKISKTTQQNNVCGFNRCIKSVWQSLKNKTQFSILVQKTNAYYGGLSKHSINIEPSHLGAYKHFTQLLIAWSGDSKY